MSIFESRNIKVNSSKFLSNTATNSRGALYFFKSENIFINDCVLMENIANELGASGIYVLESTNINISGVKANKNLCADHGCGKYFKFNFFWNSYTVQKSNNPPPSQFKKNSIKTYI